MSLFQEPAETPYEIEAGKPLDIPHERDALFGEAEWYARACRKNAPQHSLSKVG